MKALDRVADLIGASRRYLISKTVKPAGDECRASCNPEWIVQRLMEGVL